jgi:hypothetical protein
LVGEPDWFNFGSMFEKPESNSLDLHSHPRVFEGSVSVLLLCLSDCQMRN